MKELFLNFKKRIEKDPSLVEALCLSDKNGLIWSEHYTMNAKRNIYSHSKSFTSLMVGIAIDEKMLCEDTRLVDVFKDEISKENYERLYGIKVKHLLSMSSGFGEQYLMGDQRVAGQGYPDYLQFMFSRELKFEPGSKFWYSNGDTYLLGRMVEKVYGKRFIQLCYERFFKAMDIGLPMWGVDPMGYCSCASDLCLSIENMNKLGILFINKGVYNGQRIVSEEYVEKCSRKQISTEGNGWGDYSYQFWINPKEKGYRADGAYGQLTFIFEEQGYAFSIQRPEDDRGGKVIEIFTEEVLDKI